MKNLLLIICIITLVLSPFPILGQELNCKITVNSDKISGSDKSIFKNMEDAINQLVNGRKWTDVSFSPNEKIDCSMFITINEIPQENSYKADIQISSNRPVYNSSYLSPTFNFKDTEFEFNYITGQNISFSDLNIDNNLVAVISYYTYIILGLDFDSFGLNGGKPYFDKALNITTNAQSLNTKGWAPFSGDRNRYALATSLTEESTNIFHSMWYNYHRKGLDEMAENATRGRTEIENTLPDLKKIYEVRPSSAIIYFWADTKLNEIISIYTKATSEERKNALVILDNIYPAKSHVLNGLK